MTDRVAVAAWVPDLMDRSRFASGTVFVARPEDLATVDADVVVVDLNKVGDPTRVQRGGSSPGRLIGFASHVDADVLVAARAAGFDEALPRSAFFRRLGELTAGG